MAVGPATSTTAARKKRAAIYGSDTGAYTSTGGKTTPTMPNANMVASLARSGSASSPNLRGSGVPAYTYSASPTITSSPTGNTGTGIGNMGNVTSASVPSGTGGGAGGPLDQTYTGWAAGMRPGAATMLFQQPQLLLRNVMAKLGMSANDNPGMYAMGLPNADLANALAMVGLGGNADFQQGDINSVINNMGDFFKQQMSRGGKGIDFSQGMQNIEHASPDSAMGGYLNLDDPQGQVQAFSSLAMPLAESGLHPLFAKAFQNQINRLADEYYQRYAFGSNPPKSFANMVGGRLGV
jgi:hypothetical protein